MKYLSIDLGEKRIGLAISDQKGVIAQPLEIISRKSDTNAISQINEICSANNIEHIVLGIPYSASNTAQNRYKSFAAKIEDKTKINVDLWDESFSTKQAQNMVAFSDVPSSKKKTRTHRDDVAAAIILQEYLDHEKSS